MPTNFIRIVLVVSLPAIVGCASPWERFYKPNPAVAALGYKPTPREQAQIRTIEFDRFKAYVADEKVRRTASSVAPQDLTRSEKIAAKNRLLETLQLKERGDEAGILGFSEFDVPRALNLEDGSLEAEAKKVGADYAVVASTYGGRTAEQSLVPITTYSQSSATATYYGSRGYTGTAVANGSGTSTTWTPMLVPRDHYVYHCIFVRKMAPGEMPHQ